MVTGTTGTSKHKCNASYNAYIGNPTKHTSNAGSQLRRWTPQWVNFKNLWSLDDDDKTTLFIFISWLLPYLYFIYILLLVFVANVLDIS